ncbi:MAG: hypothetical protein P857_635 [Candidatus Xenolissoclinum pacificiensis L6]|uniref:Uncharacterized protein n=1 Tax=Candidatus Xenolissoclinum pacificiensis L6 TaxID=1401685 RepID=W2V123_9RICK|nr:MAG: hypothetical protein P857_635 [Candidatus Xenolissoclinum pacificiensis L6]
MTDSNPSYKLRDVKINNPSFAKSFFKSPRYVLLSSLHMVLSFTVLLPFTAIGLLVTFIRPKVLEKIYRSLSVISNTSKIDIDHLEEKLSKSANEQSIDQKDNNKKLVHAIEPKEESIHTKSAETDSTEKDKEKTKNKSNTYDELYDTQYKTSLHHIEYDKIGNISYIIDTPTTDASEEDNNILVLHIPRFHPVNHKKYLDTVSKSIFYTRNYQIAHLLGVHNSNTHTPGLLPEESKNAHIEIIKDLRKKYPDKKILIMGDQLGGAIATKVARDLLVNHDNKTPVNLLLYNSYAKYNYYLIDDTMNEIDLSIMNAPIPSLLATPFILVWYSLLFIVDIFLFKAFVFCMIVVNKNTSIFKDYEIHENLEYLQNNFPDKVNILCSNNDNDPISEYNYPLEHGKTDHAIVILPPAFVTYGVRIADAVHKNIVAI